MTAKPLSIYLIAGEPSGDALGAGLMRELRQMHEGVLFYGIGGEQMQAEGLESLFPYEDLSLMGFAEIVPHLYQLMALIGMTVDDISAKRPDVVITIDSPGFTFRVAKKLKQLLPNMLRVHYVAPTVWAWKPERAGKTAALFDHLLTLLPFEPPYFEAEGLPTTYVGHPVAASDASQGGEAFRAEYGIAASATVIGIMPGSRKGEIKRHLPIFLRAVALLAPLYRDLVMIVPLPAYLMEHAAPYFQGCPFKILFVTDARERRRAMAACNAALIKSGTVTVEAAREGLPMVVAYRTSAVSAMIAKRLLKTKYVNLVNILLKRRAVPELLQSQCNSYLLADALFALLHQPELRRRQRLDSTQALAMMQPAGGGIPSELAARTVMQCLKERYQNTAQE